MSAKTPRRSRDTNRLAKWIVDIASGQLEDAPDLGEVHPMATLGRSGGLKGGRAHADALTSERRADIARQAAAVRWCKNDK